MKTRQDYINGKCTHREYYAQFVSGHVKHRVLSHISREELLASTDPHFNDIALARWDRTLIPVPAEVAKGIRESGDYPTLAGAVCVAKEAARQIVESPTA